MKPSAAKPIRQQLSQAVAAAVTTTYPEAPTVEPQIVYAQAGFGDFTTNVAFQLAGPLKQAPHDIAIALAPVIEQHHPQIAAAEAAGAGYINLTLSQDYWQETLAAIGSDYLRSDGGQGRKLQVEFISANPTGPLTLANARGGFLGDVLANVLTAVGYGVTREYYVNDGGAQVDKLVESLQAEVGLPIEGERQYAGDYITELAKEVDPRRYDNTQELSRRAVVALLAEIKRAVAALGIQFDEWTSERQLIDGGASQRVLEVLRQHQLVYEQDGATWLASNRYGDERDRVLVKADGNYTYLLNDLAYHQSIFAERGFARAIKLWGADHAGQVSSLKLTMQQLVPKAELDFVLLQFVRLMRDGQEVKMSKRAGTYVTIDELLANLEEAVGPTHAAAVARWFFLMRSSDNRIDFDLALASQTSQQNPYFYVMYAYARAHSLLAKAAQRHLVPADRPGELKPSELALVRLMAHLPELVQEVAADFEVHRLIFFGQEVAKAFQEHYESNRIIDLEAKQAADKLYLIQQFIIFMDQFWALLGIKPVERLTEG